jgi:hypothetical protein
MMVYQKPFYNCRLFNANLPVSSWKAPLLE